jgi:NIMA (never in mitosis gene a)-related kinase
LASIDNPYIVGYKEAFYEEITGSLCMITEFAEGGDLSSYINSYRKRKQLIPE